MSNKTEKAGDMNNDGNYLLDARGLLCPEPVMMLHKKIRSIGEGEIIKMLATDPSTKRDVARFCEFLRHELLEEDTFEETFVYFIKKRFDPEK